MRSAQLWQVRLRHKSEGVDTMQLLVLAHDAMTAGRKALRHAVQLGYKGQRVSSIVASGIVDVF